MRDLEAQREARLLEMTRPCRFACPICHDASRRAAEAELQIERRGGQKNSPSLTDSWGCGVVIYVGRGPVASGSGCQAA